MHILILQYKVQYDDPPTIWQRFEDKYLRTDTEGKVVD